jgi:hypothetical protein
MMGRDRSGDRHRIDGGVREHLLDVHAAGGCGVGGAGPFQARPLGVADSDEPGAARPGDVADDIGPPVAETDHRHADLLGPHRLRLAPKTARV